MYNPMQTFNLALIRDNIEVGSVFKLSFIPISLLPHKREAPGCKPPFVGLLDPLSCCGTIGQLETCDPVSVEYQTNITH